MTDIESLLPSAKDCMQTIAVAEAKKASEYLNRMTAADAEKKALLERLEKTSGVSDEERMKRVTTIIQRPVANGQTEVMLGKVPKELFTGHGRAINKAEPGWKTR